MAAEISVIADFSLDPKVKIDVEVEMIQNNVSAPTTTDFTGVVTWTGATAVTVSSLADLPGVIANNPKSSIQKLNVFTHADRGFISFSGTVDSTAAGAPKVTLYTSLPNQSRVALDSTSLPFLQNGGTFGPNRNPNKWNPSNVKDKFMPDAVIIFFACHTGSDPNLLQAVATTLGIHVIGFKPAIAYCPSFITSPSSIDRQMDIAFGSCSSSHMRDFHRFSMAATPSQIIHRVP